MRAVAAASTAALQAFDYGRGMLRGIIEALVQARETRENKIPGLKAKSISFAFRQMAFEGSGS